MKGHAGNVTSITFSEDGDFFASGGTDRQVLIWKSNFCKDKPSKIPKQLISSSSKQEFDNMDEKLFANNDKGKDDVREEHDQEEVIN